jgi:hypothetical protein
MAPPAMRHRFVSSKERGNAAGSLRSGKRPTGGTGDRHAFGDTANCGVALGLHPFAPLGGNVDGSRRRVGLPRVQLGDQAGLPAS